jgi:hypothetical protein
VFKALQKKTIAVRIVLGLIVGALGLSMLLYLVPGQGTTGLPSSEVVALVDGEPITVAEIRLQLSRIAQNGTISPALLPLYVQQVLNQLIFQKELAAEARTRGLYVSDQERAERIRQLIPTAFVGDTFVGNEQYAAQVFERTNLGVAEFEKLIGDGLIEEKFWALVTDGIRVSPQEIEQEFRRRNDKIRVSYVVIIPEELEARINPTEAELS